MNSAALRDIEITKVPLSCRTRSGTHADWRIGLRIKSAMTNSGIWYFCNFQLPNISEVASR